METQQVNVTEADLYEAWRAAMESVSASEDDPEALTTLEIYRHVLGKELSEWNIRKTRLLLRAWLTQGVVERTKKHAESLSGSQRVPAFRLVGKEEA